MNDRHIYKSATTAQYAVRDVLAALFAQELLVRSDELFLVEPWISDIVIIDNREGTFDTLNPGWGKREIRLAEILANLAAGGTRIHIVIRPDTHNKRFLAQLEDAMLDAGCADEGRRTVHEVEIADLHTKGILFGTRVLLKGSMNLTESGVRFNDEQVSVTYDQNAISTAHVHFHSYVTGT
jgi:phosphatidylserine/phosphatidylglycerophosphate/cardiolipin synthase-like enzyme